jgi:hypothetical protein
VAEAATEAYCSGATSVATLHGACAVTWLQLLAQAHVDRQMATALLKAFAIVHVLATRV